jgi:hypothetical protein
MHKPAGAAAPSPVFGAAPSSSNLPHWKRKWSPRSPRKSAPDASDLPLADVPSCLKGASFESEFFRSMFARQGSAADASAAPPPPAPAAAGVELQQPVPVGYVPVGSVPAAAAEAAGNAAAATTAPTNPFTRLVESAAEWMPAPPSSSALAERTASVSLAHDAAGKALHPSPGTAHSVTRMPLTHPPPTPPPPPFSATSAPAPAPPSPDSLDSASDASGARDASGANGHRASQSAAAGGGVVEGRALSPMSERLVSHVTRYVTCVACHTSCKVCHMTCQTSVSHVTRHVTCVTCHTSCNVCHMSHIM